jgi:hypothetical protein
MRKTVKNRVSFVIFPGKVSFKAKLYPGINTKKDKLVSLTRIFYNGSAVRCPDFIPEGDESDA